LVRTRERELGVEIFMRTGGPNSGTLTVAGNGAFVAAEEILHILEIGLHELEV
jgi:DNA-binding transcriptional LysR family regulator